MIKVLLIAPYQGLIKIAENYIGEHNNLSIDVSFGNLEDGVQLAEQAELDGYDVIISRGGTANLIEQAVNIPVVDIKVSGYDILRILTLLKETSGKVALVGFSNISRGASTICDILEMDVKTITIDNSEEVVDRLKQLEVEGYSIVIGDVVTVHEAEQLGLQGILITSGKEAVQEAFGEAERLYHRIQKAQEQAMIFSDSLEKFPHPLAIMKHGGQLLFKNEKFREEWNDTFLERRELATMAEEVLREKHRNWKTIQYNNKRYLIEAYPTRNNDSVVSFIIYQDLLYQQSGIEVRTDFNYRAFNGESKQTIHLKHNIKRYAHSQSPIWIEGEDGTGRTTYAGNLHFERFKNSAPLMFINLSTTSIKHIQTLFQRNLSSIPKEGTIVFRRVEDLSIGEQEEALALFKELSEHYQIILISSAGVEKLVKDGRLAHSLYYKLSSTHINLPPLRERPQDIKSLVHSFIAQSHIDYGSETIGIKEEALDLLASYDWPGNIDQLKKIIFKLMDTSTNSYIERQDVDNIFKEEPSSPHLLSDSIQTGGTMKELEKQIIEKVLQEEDNNQSKAAKRLGINRTTLWRKLNS